MLARDLGMASKHHGMGNRYWGITRWKESSFVIGRKYQPFSILVTESCGWLKKPNLLDFDKRAP
jgi:hypothetical protein